MNELFKITKEPIDVNELIQHVTRRKAGAITTFIGTVREWTNGKKTLRLTYEAYIPMAENMLSQIGQELKNAGLIQKLPLCIVLALLRYVTLQWQ